MTSVSVNTGSNIILKVDRGVAGPTGPAGAAGPTGPTGAEGQGIAITATVATPQDLPPTGNPGDAILVTSTNTLYVWSAT